MRIARIKTQDNRIRHAVIESDNLFLIEGDLFGRWERTDQSIPLKDVTLLAPVDSPDILAIGKNYRAHAEEFDSQLPTRPLLFIKARTSLNDPDGTIVLPKIAPDEVDYEAELAVVIGKKAKNVGEREALDYVFGYTCANDISARDCQMTDGQWARGKSFDTFAPLGPWIETEFDPANVNIKLRLNDTILQESNTSLLIFNVPYLIHFLSQGITLLPGTVILTGTPAGVGFARSPKVFLRPGDRVEVEIDGIGVLRNTVRSEQ